MKTILNERIDDGNELVCSDEEAGSVEEAGGDEKSAVNQNDEEAEAETGNDGRLSSDNEGQKQVKHKEALRLQAMDGKLQQAQRVNAAER